MTYTKSLKSLTAALILILTTAAILMGMNLSALRVTHVTSGSANTPAKKPNEIVVSVTSGPFRDGLYQGKLAKEYGSKQHIAVGRWTSQVDRAAYAVGYLQGYTSSVAATSASRDGN